MKDMEKKIIGLLLFIFLPQLVCIQCLGISQDDAERIAIESRLRNRLVLQIRLIAQRERDAIIRRGVQARQDLVQQEQRLLVAQELRRQDAIQRQVLRDLEQAENHDTGIAERLTGLSLIDALIAAQRRIMQQDGL